MWTNRLHEIWKENRESDPKLLWQYFGTQSGIMRNYPGTKNLKTYIDDLMYRNMMEIVMPSFHKSTQLAGTFSTINGKFSNY